MSSLSLTKRGVATITSDDAGTSKDIALPGDAIKTGSSFRVVSIREQRKRVRVQRGSFAITDASMSPLTAAIDEVDLEAAEIHASLKQSRNGTFSGATVKLTDVDEVTCEFEVETGDTVDVEFEVKETLKELGATARILDDETLRVEWDRELEDGETITVAYEIVDLNDVGNKLAEILFREQRILGYLGENVLRDDLLRDDAGNRVTWRVRVFDTKAHLEAATFDLPDGDGLEEGELARYKATKDVDIGNNDLQSLALVRTHLAETPDLS